MEATVIELGSVEQIRLNRRTAEKALIMTQLIAAHRIMSVLPLLVLLSIGAFAQSDSASRPTAPAATADKQAGDKQTGEKSGQGSRAAHSDSSYVIGANDVLAI